MTQPTSINERSFGAFSKHQMSLAEYYVMGTIGYGIYLPPEALAKQSFAETQGDPRGEVSVEKLLEAVSSCLSKGWLHVFTPAESELKMKLMKPIEGTQDKVNIHAGSVGFTQKGYSLFTQVIYEIFGAERAEQLPSFQDV